MLPISALCFQVLLLICHSHGPQGDLPLFYKHREPFSAPPTWSESPSSPASPTTHPRATGEWLDRCLYSQRKPLTQLNSEHRNSKEFQGTGNRWYEIDQGEIRAERNYKLRSQGPFQKAPHNDRVQQRQWPTGSWQVTVLRNYPTWEPHPFRPDPWPTTQTLVCPFAHQQHSSYHQGQAAKRNQM